jgi:hypothetical protein
MNPNKPPASSMANLEIKIGNQLIGDGYPCCVIGAFEQLRHVDHKK